MPYVASRSLRRRRGLGMSCPGDPGCPGYVAPDSMDYQTSLLRELLAGQQDYRTTYQYPPGGNGLPIMDGDMTGGFSFTQFLNGNAGKIAIGAGVLFGVVLLGKAMR